MVRIEDGTSKKCLFTLKEKTTISDPYYLFTIENNNGDEVVWSNTDNSLYKVRYNSFTFSNNVDASTSAGGFTASIGFYNYTVYESEYNNLIIASASSVVETGILEVYGTGSNSFVELDDVADNDFVWKD